MAAGGISQRAGCGTRGVGVAGVTCEGRVTGGRASALSEIDLPQGLSHRPQRPLSVGQSAQRAGPQREGAALVDELDGGGAEQHHEDLVDLVIAGDADRVLPHADGATVELMQFGSPGARAASHDLIGRNRLIVERDGAGLGHVVHATDSSGALLVEGELLRELQILRIELLDVDVFEGEHAHRLHEPVGTVDIPHPDIVHGQFEVEIVLGVLPHQLDLIGQVEPPLRLNDIAELAYDVPVFPEQRKLDLAVVILELVVIHSVFNSTLFPMALCRGTECSPPVRQAHLVTSTRSVRRSTSSTRFTAQSTSATRSSNSAGCFSQVRRWKSVGPSSAMAAMCSELP